MDAQTQTRLEVGFGYGSGHHPQDPAVPPENVSRRVDEPMPSRPHVALSSCHLVLMPSVATKVVVARAVGGLPLHPRGSTEYVGPMGRFWCRSSHRDLWGSAVWTHVRAALWTMSIASGKWLAARAGILLLLTAGWRDRSQICADPRRARGVSSPHKTTPGQRDEGPGQQTGSVHPPSSAGCQAVLDGAPSLWKGSSPGACAH